MRQLATTGWMHNRARLITACFLVKDLHIDWRRGEQHFMRCLLDGDVANNNGNWQWISSVGVDPAPLHRRLYNPMLQQQRHDPDGAYVRRWVPELDDIPLEQLATPWEAGGRSRSSTTPSSAERTLAAYAARAARKLRRDGGASRSSRAGRSRSPPPRASSRAGRRAGRRRTTTRSGSTSSSTTGAGRRTSSCARTAASSTGTVEADNEERAIAQAARIVSLDHDGTRLPRGRRARPDRRRAAARRGYLRPVLFHSPYEAAAWSVISARTRTRRR